MKMEQYVGIKLVQAAPMTRGEYNAYRGWALPENEKASDAGFLIEYAPQDGNPGNDSRHEGYITWTPATAFEPSYRKVNAWWGAIWTLLDTVLKSTRSR